jgi:hypothetical protein
VKVFLLLLLLLDSIAPGWAGSHNHPAKPEPPADPGYVFALAAATNFLHAWQTGDVENGMIQLSDNIRQTQNPDKLEQFFSNGTSNANKRAFEITRGHGHSGLYSFPLVLVTLRGSHVTRKTTEIMMVETGKNDWVVDKLP